jgi:hypothetical protein
MMLFRRRRERGVPPSFGGWVLRHFTKGEATSGMPFARLEQVCSNVGSLLCGAAFARPEVFRASASGGPAAAEADVIARRTADGFKAALADRQHTIVTWPWDHLATRVAWQSTRAGTTDEENVGRQLEELGAAYALGHRDQLERVLRVWADIVAGIGATTPGSPPDLAAMGGLLLRAFENETAPAGFGSVHRGE